MDTGTRYAVVHSKLFRRDVIGGYGYRAPAAHFANVVPWPVARAARVLSAAAGIVGSTRRRRRQPVEYNGREGEHQAGVRVGVFFSIFNIIVRPPS